MKYEYLRRLDLTDDELNTLGSEGWELISKIYHSPEERNHPAHTDIDGNRYPASIVTIPAFTEFTFKREIPETIAQEDDYPKLR
jgi:hypothetical protein